MNGRERFKISRHSEKDFSLRPTAFTFIDKKTGTQRFEVKPHADGSMPVDAAVSLLVVHCLMRNQMPNEFAVMVPAGENFLDGPRQRARKLIHADGRMGLIHKAFDLLSVARPPTRAESPNLAPARTTVQAGKLGFLVGDWCT